MKINRILIMILLLALIYPASAEIIQIQLPVTEDTKDFTFSDNNQIELVTTDTSNTISELKLSMRANLNNTSENRNAVITLGNNFTYIFLEKKYYYQIFGIDTPLRRHNLVQYLNYESRTVFNQTIDESDLYPAAIFLTITFDVGTANTTFNMQTTIITYREYTDKNYMGMPSPDILIQSTLPFDLTGTYINYYQKVEFQNKVKQLGGLARILYKALTLNGYFGDSDLIYSVVSIIQLFLDFISFIFAMFFTYPYLILVYIITFGNFFVAYKSNTLREIVFNYKDYIIFLMKTTYGAVNWVVANYVIVTVIIGIVAVLRFLDWVL